MDFLFSIFAVIAIAILLVVAVWFGLTLLVFIVSVALVSLLLSLLNHGWRRWRFLKRAEHYETRAHGQIIEADYQRIDEKEKDV